MNTLLVVGEWDYYSKTLINLKFPKFLDFECERCLNSHSAGNDPFIEKYFQDKLVNSTSTPEIYFRIFGYGCPVCNRTKEDEEFLGDLYSNLFEKVPIFLNSANYDVNFQQNSEYNNFLLVDRYMLSRDDWRNVLKEIDNKV
jgi:hypothetical protein